jgi:hypothetical protein
VKGENLPHGLAPSFKNVLDICHLFFYPFYRKSFEDLLLLSSSRPNTYG